MKKILKFKLYRCNPKIKEPVHSHAPIAHPTEKQLLHFGLAPTDMITISLSSPWCQSHKVTKYMVDYLRTAP